MAISGPIIPRDFTPMAPAESGIAPDTVAGRIDGDEPIEAFFLQKELLRTFSGTSRSQLEGPTTIQIVADESENAEVLFDQTFTIGITAVGADDPLLGSGVGLFTWFFNTESFNASVGKFKTRIVNGQPIPQVLEADAQAKFNSYPKPEAPLPEAPGYVHLHTYRTTSIVAQMPAALPLRASSFTLQVAAGGVLAPVEADWRTFASDLRPGDRRVVQANFVAGESNVERLWFRLLAVNSDGSTRGPAVRDAPQSWMNNRPTGGYQGWQAGYVFGAGPPSPFHEAGSGYQEPSPTVSIGGRIIGRWSGPIYKCELPAGAIIKIFADFWNIASSVSDKFTFSVSYRPGGLVEVAVQHPDLGKTFYLYKDDGAARLAQDRRREGFKALNADPIVFDFSPTAMGLVRHRGVLVALGGRSQGLSLGLSYDDGRRWQEQENVVPNTKNLAECVDDAGTIYIVGRATATEIDSEIPEDQWIKQNDLVRVVIRPSNEGGVLSYVEAEKTKILPQGETKLPTKNATRLFLERGVFNLIARDGDDFRLWQSDDDLKTLREVSPTAAID